MDERQKCCVAVYRPGAPFFRNRSGCLRDGKIERNGKWYCTMHDPVRVAEKNASTQKKWEEKFEAQKKDYYLRNAAPALLEALRSIQRRLSEADTLTRRANILSPPINDALAIARAAIAKAEGRE